MEYGLIPRMNQYADNTQVKIQQIQPSNEVSLLKNNNESAQIERETFLKGIETKSVEKVSETKEVSNQEISKYNEVALTNLNFGYNNSSHDFYVKAIRGEAKSQYPTDEMMKLKAFFIAEAKAQMQANISN
ncbi:MAG: hypothetical protein WBF48_08750 [Halarcobacter sp.]